MEANMAASNYVESSNESGLPAAYGTFPPGTVLLEDPNAKTNHGRDGHVVLQPTPSRDPNDPLNVSTAFKHLSCFPRMCLGPALPPDIIHTVTLSTMELVTNTRKQWTNGRKWFNFGIICFYALMIFAM